MLACRPPEHRLKSDDDTSDLTEGTQPTKEAVGGLFPRQRWLRQRRPQGSTGKIHRNALAGG